MTAHPIKRAPAASAPGPRWLHVDIDTARAFIASRLLASGHPHGAPLRLGTITLLPHQRDAVIRLRHILSRFRGALLADDVGLGKTYVALGVAQEYGEVHVIAPAALLPMWRLALERTARTGVSLHSLQGCSRRTPDIGVPTAKRGLIIIDEAHHLRTASTQRYRAVAEAVVGHDVLLLSATPIHNRPHDLRAQLGIFMSPRDDLLDPDMLAHLIVRRTSEFLPPPARLASAQVDPIRVRPIASRRPVVSEHPPCQVPHDPATLAGILALPAPLPAHDGAAAGALVRLGLLRAWCSSDAALDDALVRRLLRGSALRDALTAGRHPTNGELRAWVVGDHREMQLAFPEIVTATHMSSPDLLQVLRLHVEALSALRDRHRAFAQGDAARATYLRHTMTAHPGVSMIAFSQFSSTVRSLYRALSDIAGVGMLTGSGARIASGRISRREMIARFAPHAQGLPPPPSHGAVRLLLATDLLAEGVNLQDAGIVVHLDLPWTDALRQQRIGRVARLGSAQDRIHVYALHPPACGERALRQLERLRIKADHGTRLIGSANGSSAPDHASMLRATLQSWMRDDVSPGVQGRPRAGGDDAPEGADRPRLIAVVPATRRQALVLVDGMHTPQLLVCHDGAAGGVVSELAIDVALCVRRIDGVESSRLRRLRGHLAAHIASVENVVNGFLATRRVRSQAGVAPRALSSAQRQALERIRGVPRAASPMYRNALARAADDASAAVFAASGAAGDRALLGWLASSAALPPGAWLSRWKEWPALRTRAERSASHTSIGEAHQSEMGAIRVIVLLEPPAGR